MRKGCVSERFRNRDIILCSPDFPVELGFKPIGPFTSRHFLASGDKFAPDLDDAGPGGFSGPGRRAVGSARGPLKIAFDVC